MARSRLFKFNLLPRKSDAQEELEVDRDSSVIYAFVLVLLASIIYLCVILVQGLLTAPRVVASQEQLTTRDAQIASFNQTKQLYGELYIKLKSLKSVLEKDINPSEIFRVTDAIEQTNQNVRIESYNRERTGTFVFQIITSSYESASELLRNTKLIPGVSEVFLRDIALVRTNNTVKVTITLTIDAS